LNDRFTFHHTVTYLHAPPAAAPSRNQLDQKQVKKCAPPTLDTADLAQTAANGTEGGQKNLAKA